MRFLICGDVVGNAGKEIIIKNVPLLRKNESIDFVIINGENSFNGFGITREICEKFYSIGVDVITSGNHIWDHKRIMSFIDSDQRLLRPLNYPKTAPGKGFGIYETKKGIHVVVINILCRLFMDLVDDPFLSLEDLLKLINNKYEKMIIIVDIHGEATSEKMALAHFLDGKVNIVIGTHTHVPTADQQILEKGTFFQTDLGMCGDYDSVIGMKKDTSILRFRSKHLKTRSETANGNATLCAALIDINEKKFSVNSYKQIKIGGKLGD